ncbi:MAG: hypothetical protein HC881_13545 [Leptolyngbyaceae cyanobacterium SL_7_1]|nr:hypothetical protein [Leptolyngbyaceae cyanobacterium SL_7_1]
MKTRLLTIFAMGSLLTTSIALPMPAIAQRVVNVEPAIDSRNISPATSISGQFEAGSGVTVDPSSVRIFVNGQEVTDRSTVTRNFFTYRPDSPLAPGSVQVRVDYRTSRGEQRTASWNFTVQAADPIQITAVSHNAIGASPTRGFNFVVTLNGTPGAEASVLLVQDQRTTRELPARETSAGVYVASLTVGANDRVSEGVVIGRLRDQTQVVYAAAPEPFAFNRSVATGGTGGTTGGSTPSADAPQPPRFTSHRNGDRVSGSFTLTGQTSPNATVQVQVTTSVSVLDVIDLGGQTLVDEEVTANSRGEFQISVPASSIPVPGTEYRIRAVAELGSATSSETELTLRQR